MHSLDPLDSFFVGNQTVAANESALEDTIVGGENCLPIEAAQPSRAYRQLYFDTDESSDGGELDQAFIEDVGPRRAKHAILYKGLIKKKGRNNPAEVIRYASGKAGDVGRWFFRPVYARFCSTSHGWLKFNESCKFLNCFLFKKNLVYEGSGDDIGRMLRILDKLFRNRAHEMEELENELNRGEYGVIIESETHLLPVGNIQFGIADLKKTDPDREPEHDELPAYALEP